MHKDDRLPVEPFVMGYTYDNPQISPNGKLLSYLQRSDHGTDLLIHDLSTHTQKILLFNETISTGTPYGGQTYCWSHNSRDIVYSSKGHLYKISIDGGISEKVVSLDRSFHPMMDSYGLYFIVEHEDHMSLAMSSSNKSGFDWPQRLPVTFHFMYDPVRHNDGHFFVHAWDFPNMSWNGSKIIKIDSNGSQEVIAGSESIYTTQPRLSPDHNYLTFFSEEKGWRNLWIADGSGKNPRILVEEEAEHTYSTWTSGAVNNVWIYDDLMVVTRLKDGAFTLFTVDPSGTIKDLDLPRGYYLSLSTDHQGRLVCLFEDTTTPMSVMSIEISRSGEVISKKSIASSGLITKIYHEKFIQPEHISYPTRDGETAHGLLYRPDPVKYPSNNMKPLLISAHGGPTGVSTARFNFNAQYFANQGWVVLLVNYRGSIGYGKDYRNKLNGKWGFYDVDDSVDSISYLAETEGVDINKVAIMGGSAGGYTTLMALIRYPGTFAAGINLFGVSDLFLLAEETHYLESHYLDILVGQLPEDSPHYRDTSPINSAEKIVDPLLILQGADDPVVPKNQSELIFSQVKGTKEMKIYDGEGHGFRKIDTLKDMYPRIDKFLRKYVIYK